MKAKRTSRQIPAMGAVISCILLVATGIGYRVMADRFESAAVGVPLPRGSLAGVPLEIGDWVGTEVPMEEAIIKRTDTDDHINRTYRKRYGREAVSVFVGCGIRLRDLMPHRPTVCYVGAGWTLDQSETVTLEVDTLGEVPCKVHTFYRSGLDAARIAVLNYYIIDGQYSEDVSLLRSKARTIGLGAKYMAQVQVAAKSGHSDDAGIMSVRSFAAESAGMIRDALEAAAEAVKTAEGSASIKPED